MAKVAKSVALVGPGNVGRTLAALLPKAGYRVDEIVTREGAGKSREIARLATRLRARVTTLERATFDAPVIWLTVGDSAIRSCAESLAAHGPWKNKVVLHASGALSSDELRALRRKGASVASAHPMMSFAGGELGSLSGICWTVEGDATAVRAARRIVGALGGEAFEIEKRNKPLYHAFGAFLSPLLVAQLQVASELAVQAGIPRQHVAGFMAPIVGRTLENLLRNIGEKGGAGKAFSGPLVRGDTGTIAKHLQTLRRRPAGKLYRALVEAAVESDLPVRNRAEIRKLIRGSK